jgi:bla regulator protein blaR1
MTTLLDTAGPAIWRASWQAAALAILVALLLRCLGERLAPRWRFLLWGVVLTRLLVVATPVSPWSVFNLARWDSGADERPIAWGETVAPVATIPPGPDATPSPGELDGESPRVGDSAAAPGVARVLAPTEALSPSPETVPVGTPPGEGRFDAVFLTRALSSLWLAGCLVLGLKLLVTALVLRRRLSACRPVTDASVRGLLEATRRRLGLKRTPALLVTPEGLSPCLVGTWNPRIVLPESVLTQSSPERLCHVLAHELAHVVRGDLWTNWLLLAARALHWFNPVAWWAVREMQAEREPVRFDVPPAGACRTPRAVPFGHEAPGTARRRLGARGRPGRPDRRHAGRSGPSAESSRVGRARGTRGKDPHLQRALRQSRRRLCPGRGHGAVVPGGRTNVAAG